MTADNEAVVDLTGKRKPSMVYPYFVVGTLTLMYALSFLDRQLVAILAEPIKQDLGLTDTQLGLLGGFMFALFYTTFGIPIAWAADRTNRVKVIALACGVWSLFTAACGLAQNFAQLALGRIGVGIGEAGGSPPSYSIIADYFPPDRRGLALSIYSLGIPLGTTAGTAVGGWVAAEYGWRMAFIAIGLPGIVIALVTYLTIREPQRGRYDGVPVARPSLPVAIGAFFRNPILSLTALSSACSAFVGYGMLVWAPAFLMRMKGMTLSEVALYYSVVSGLACAVGVLGIGLVVDRLSRRSPKAYALVPGGTFLVALPFYVAAVLADDWRISLAFLAVPLSQYIMFVAPAMAVVQNYAPPAQRSTSSALLLFVLNLVGVGCGPVYVGLVSDWATGRSGGSGLETGMLALAPFFLVAFGSHLLAARVLPRRAASKQAGVVAS